MDLCLTFTNREVHKQMWAMFNQKTVGPTRGTGVSPRGRGCQADGLWVNWDEGKTGWFHHVRVQTAQRDTSDGYQDKVAYYLAGYMPAAPAGYNPPTAPAGYISSTAPAGYIPSTAPARYIPPAAPAGYILAAAPAGYTPSETTAYY